MCGAGSFHILEGQSALKKGEILLLLLFLLLLLLLKFQCMAICIAGVAVAVTLVDPLLL